MKHSRLYVSALLILMALILFVSFFHLIRDIRDLDFFWHLKTGEWIWQNRALPSEDPFSFMTKGPLSTWEYFLMTQNWLSQLIFHILHGAGGMWGIVLFRFIIAGALIYVMMKRKEGDGILYAGLLLLFLSLILKSYPLERPQAFSFLFFAILLYLLNSLKVQQEKIRKSSYFLLPLVMLLWANVHGGFILGNVTLILYMVFEAIKFIHPSLRPINKNSYKRLLFIATMGFAVTFISPNTYHFLSESVLLQSENVTARNLEYQSTIRIFRIYSDYSVIVYWFVLALTSAGLAVNRKKTDITEVALLAGTAFYSFTTLRYVAFFLIAALPAAGRSFSGSMLLKPLRVIIFAGSIFTGVFFTLAHVSLHTVKSGEWVSKDRFPAGAVEFILNNNLKGNMYNSYNWGGYLIWRLAPERKVFVDGRGLKPSRHELSSAISSVSSVMYFGIPEWKAILRANNVQFIVIPFTRKGGGVSPLGYALLRDRDWIPVYIDHNAVIYVLDKPAHDDVIGRYALSEDYLIKRYLYRR